MFKSSARGGSRFHGLERRLSGGAPDDPSLPVTMRRAVRFMLAGAAISFAYGLFAIIVTAASRSSLDLNGKPITSSQFRGAILGDLIQYVIVFTLLWLLTARFNRMGLKWARIVASALFAIWTFEMFNVVDSLHGGQVINGVNIIALVLLLASWGVGVGAIAMLWRSDSTAFYQAQAIRRQ
jgi:hypothetical protein